MSITAYPLCWPEGWPRTDSADRRYGRFSKKRKNSRGWTTNEDVTIAEALARISSEIMKLDGPSRNWQRVDPDQVVISTNLSVRKSDGLPASSQKAPSDPGAAVYFELDGKRQCVPCDSYTQVAQNLAGVAATLEALRTLERHGSGLMERAFTGFEALPDLSESESWWQVLGVFQHGSSPEAVKHAYKTLRSRHHPDRNGDPVMFNKVQKAFEEYRQLA